MTKDSGIHLFRITMGTMMVGHGLMKVFGGIDFIQKLGGMPPFVPNNDAVRLVLGFVAVACELLGGLGVITGFRFRTACIAIIAVMIPAWLYHLGNVSNFETFMRNAWPLELAFVFASFAIIGPGKRKLSWPFR